MVINISVQYSGGLLPDINRVATKVRTYFEMRTDGQRFLCLKSRISILRRYL